MKKIFVLILSLIIILSSFVTVYADTTVNDSSGQALLRQELFNTDYDNFDLSFLPSGDYLTFVSKDFRYGINDFNTVCIFIPQTNKKIVNLGLIDYDPTIAGDPDTIYLYMRSITDLNGYQYNSFKFSVCFTYYVIIRDADGLIRYYEVKSAESSNHFSNEFIFVTDKNNSGCQDILWVNNNDIYNTFLEYEHTSSNHNIVINDTYIVNDYSLFYNLTQIFGGYTGTIYDSSLEFILNSNATDCDSSIIDKYKYKIYYARNNINEYVFLNNTYEPKVEKSQYTGTNTDLAYKYKFTYQNTSNAIVYFPRLNKYLSYDDWYELQPKDNNFKWFWDTSDDNKSFILYSDWTYNNGDYVGTRVAYSWDNTNNGVGENLDFHSFASLIEDKDYFLNNGWKAGRPKDVNYPYCIEVDYDGKPTLFIYSNSKFNFIRANYFSETCTEFEVNMLASYGYIYNAITDTYINYDMTINTGRSQFKQSIFKSISFICQLDEDLSLHIWDNYRGTPDDYVGTRVFFNFDLIDYGFREGQMDNYYKPDLGKFVDDNGNSHGGNLNDYTDDDLNNFNTPGSNTTNNSNNDFEFSYDNVYDYVDDYFYFIERVFSIFPTFIWVILSLSLTLLIVLRVLGR